MPAKYLARLGYPDRPVDKSFGFSEDDDLLNYVARNDKPHPIGARCLRSGRCCSTFGTGKVRSEMVAEGRVGRRADAWSRNVLTTRHRRLSGMITVWLDARRPLAVAASTSPAGGIFRIGGAATGPCARTGAHCSPPRKSIQRNFTPSRQPGIHWPPPTNVKPGTASGPAAAVHCTSKLPLGMESLFTLMLMGPWTQARAHAEPEGSRTSKSKMIAKEGSGISFFTLAIVVVLGGIWFAVRNIARGRGDRKGAWRLAWAFLLWKLPRSCSARTSCRSMDTLF